MVALTHYKGREQSYVKHIFLESYLEALVHKTASQYAHVVYVDGFAGPWQSANESFDDTSFGIALKALRQAKASWKAKRDVRMSAHLVERDPTAYARLTKVPERYPDILVRTYQGAFLAALPTILKDIPRDAFTFFFVDPKGWGIPLQSLQPMLARRNSEVIFNFMFDFINRAVNIKDSAVAQALDELMPYGDFRGRLSRLEQAHPNDLLPDQRKAVLVEAFGESLSRLGNYDYVAETAILRPAKDRTLYCLFYATRHPKGIEVFRDCQIKALAEQSKTRAATKVSRAESASGQKELFQSLHDMGPDEFATFTVTEQTAAEKTLLELTPVQPTTILYEKLWPQVLARHVVRLPDVNKIAARLREHEALLFPDWERGKRVPQAGYRVQRPTMPDRHP
jgi:three-Cys-motif partner protein